MKFELKQADIEQAIIGHIENMGIDISGKEFDMKFLAGRKGNGVSCSVVMSKRETLVDKLAGDSPSVAVLDDNALDNDTINEPEDPIVDTEEDTESVQEEESVHTDGSIFGNNN